MGTPPPGDTVLTVAVIVTASPSVEGFNEELTVVDVLAFTTFCPLVRLMMVSGVFSMCSIRSAFNTSGT